MFAKRIVAAVLLFFVAIDLGVLAARHFRQGQNSLQSPAAQTVASATGEKVVVYYFHARERCETCRNIEAYAHEALENGFGKQLGEGGIEWRVVDFDEPANRHFDRDYQLGGIPSVVLVRMMDGKSLACEVLPAAWGSINSDTRPEFIEYVQKEIRGFMQQYGGRRVATVEVGNERKPHTFAWGLLWALWLGIFTAITPCTLVSNVAAVSYIGRRVDSPRRVVGAGLLYAFGQTLAYAVLGCVLVAGLLASSVVSSFLHHSTGELLGPLMIVTAMFLLGMIEVGVSAPGVSEKMQRRVDALGVWGAFLLGVLFALSFCPVSGGLFFLQLIPQAAYLDSPLVLPALYGIGNALPVVVFAILLAYSAQAMGRAFNRLTQIERYLRFATGAIFLAGGVFFTLRYVWP